MVLRLWLFSYQVSFRNYLPLSCAFASFWKIHEFLWKIKFIFVEKNTLDLNYFVMDKLSDYFGKFYM